MGKQVKMRLQWVRLYEKIGDAGLTFTRAGMLRPSLRLWARRYKEQCMEKLSLWSNWPHANPNLNRFPEVTGCAKE